MASLILLISDKPTMFLLLIIDFVCLGAYWACSRNL